MLIMLQDKSPYHCHKVRACNVDDVAGQVRWCKIRKERNIKVYFKHAALYGIKPYDFNYKG